MVAPEDVGIHFDSPQVVWFWQKEEEAEEAEAGLLSRKNESGVDDGTTTRVRDSSELERRRRKRRDSCEENISFGGSVHVPVAYKEQGTEEKKRRWDGMG